MPERTPRNVYAFGLTSFFNDTASEMAYWVLPAFLASIGAGPAQLGIIEGIAESVASFAKLLSGRLADRVQRRKPLVVAGYVVANAVKPLLALTTSWTQILGIRFADRFSKGIRGTADHRRQRPKNGRRQDSESVRPRVGGRCGKVGIVGG